MMGQCGDCHEEEAETFFDTYHGKVSRLGGAGPPSATTATARTNPASLRTGIDPEPGQRGRDLRPVSPGRQPALRGLPDARHASRPGKVSLAVLVLLGHDGAAGGNADLRPHRIPAPGCSGCGARPSNGRARRAAAEGPTSACTDGSRRSSARLHLVMILSFITLALTGMALKFSYMGGRSSSPASPVDSRDGRAAPHRRRGADRDLRHSPGRRVQAEAGREGELEGVHLQRPNTLMFNKQDLTRLEQLVQVVLRQGSATRVRPLHLLGEVRLFRRVLGVFIIGSTGLFLWFPEFFTRLLPGLVGERGDDHPQR